jgi:hypothetical protein
LFRVIENGELATAGDWNDGKKTVKHLGAAVRGRVPGREKVIFGILPRVSADRQAIAISHCSPDVVCALRSVHLLKLRRRRASRR